jgi:hypothetical protein
MQIKIWDWYPSFVDKLSPIKCVDESTQIGVDVLKLFTGEFPLCYSLLKYHDLIEILIYSFLVCLWFTTARVNF